MKNQHLQQLIDRTQAATEKVKATFGNLSPEQFNWNPEPGKWSIGQLVEHMVKTAEPYFPVLDKVNQPGYNPGFLAKLSFPSRYLGRMIANGTDTETKKNMRTVKLFTPSASDISINVIDKFEATNNKLVDYIKTADNLDLENTLVVSPAASIVSFTLNELLNLMVNHADRHINQGVKIMDKEGFPG